MYKHLKEKCKNFLQVQPISKPTLSLTIQELLGYM